MMLSCGAFQGLWMSTSQASGLANAVGILNTPLNSRTHCPWVGQALRHSKSPSQLANEVIAKMTLSDKARFVVLETGDGIENFNDGVPTLCIPPLTLSDGPDGLAGQVEGVTRLPAAIGVAATFDRTVALDDGQVIGREARIKGVDVVQGPDLNLARVPQGGRVFESFGEDPYLTSVMGVATVEGIQSQGVMALAKHFSAYTQETARTVLNQTVPVRALAELYDVPFEEAVEQAHVAALMCSVGMINSVPDCSDPYLYSQLASWGFTGFVRSDNRGATNVAQAFAAGLDMVKPNTPEAVEALVRSKALPMKNLDRAVRRVLTQMFVFGLVTHPRHPHVKKVATSLAHQRTALIAAEESVVLLKNSNVLPLPKSLKSVAIIGTDASSQSVNTGGGSSMVKSSTVITPLSALRHSLGLHVKVRFAPGGPLTFEIDHFSSAGVVSARTLPLQKRIKSQGDMASVITALSSHPYVSESIETAAQPGTGAGWDHWHIDLRVRTSGTYEVSLRQIGDTWLYLDGRPLLSSRGLHARSDLATTVLLHKGVHYSFGAKWFAVPNHGSPTFGIVDVSHAIASAVALARRSQSAIVFAGDLTSEGSDRPNLSLPGDENALIEAVAAVNPRTIVVLNTGGAVLMPWLNHVAAVLEAWYPGREDGTAIAHVLTGAFDPSGRLPITFPSSYAAQPAATAATFPGVNSVVDFGTSLSSLDIGYRWYQANHVTPLFPFGYGLDYTTFSLSQPSAQPTPTGYLVHVTVTNTGRREGADVVQIYVHDPSVTGEPPEQLRNFVRVSLAPSQSKNVNITVPNSAFQVYLQGAMTTVPGQYFINVGQSSEDLPLQLAVNL
jgi:beta-glucosidase